MRVLALVVLFVVGWANQAGAEKAKAKEEAKIYNRAGERGQVVIKVKEGQVMRIDRKEGRWYKVRVSGRTGWIPRSKVELLTEEEMARNTRRRPFVDGRGTKRGFNGGGAPDDRVGEDATTTVDDEEDGGKKPAVKKPVDDEEDEEDKKPAGKKPDPKKPEPKAVKPEPKKPEPKKPEVKKPEPKKPEVKVKDEEEDGDTDGEEPKAAPKASGKEDDEEASDDRPKAHVKKKTVAFSDPDPDSEESFTAKPDTVLHPTGNKKGKYVEVESDEGDVGFILASDLTTGGGGGSVSKKSDDDDGPSTPSGPRQIDVRARAGFTLVGQSMKTEVPGVTGGDMQPDNYDLSTSAVTVSLGGTYLKPLKGGKTKVGAELGLDIAKAIPGIKVSSSKTTGITIYDLNLRAMAGKVLRPATGTAIYGRLGFHFHSFQVADVGNLTENTAKLPSEIVKAPTFGAAFVMPQLTSKIGLRVSADIMFIGASMQQTKGLEDGTAATAKGIDLGVGITYKWKPGMDISGAYDLNRTTYDFGGPEAMSMRGHPTTATAIGRTDTFHGLTVGVSKAF